MPRNRRLPLYDTDRFAHLNNLEIRGLATPDFYLRCEHDEEPDSNCPYCAGRWCYPCRLYGHIDNHPPCTTTPEIR